MKKIHVLLIVKAYQDTYDPGSGVFLQEQAIALVKNGIQTGMIAVNFISWKHIFKTISFKFGKKKASTNNIQSIVYQTPVIPFFKSLNFSRRNRLLKKLAEEYISTWGKPDLCHVHGFYCGNEAIRLKKTYNIPFVTTEHYSVFARNMANRREKKIAAHVYAESSERIAVTEEFKELLQHMFKQKFISIPNIVNVDKFSLKPDIAERKGFRFICIGSLDRNKNQQLLLKAFARITKADCSLTIAGNGPLMNELKVLAESLKINDRVHFAGFVAHDHLVDLLHQSDALVISSKYETFGVVIIEALSCGIPVVSTPVGVAQSILHDENLGYLCSYDEQDMAKSLTKIMENRFDKKYLRNFATANFSEDTIVYKLHSLYSETIDLNK